MFTDDVQYAPSCLQDVPVGEADGAKVRAACGQQPWAWTLLRPMNCGGESAETPRSVLRVVEVETRWGVLCGTSMPSLDERRVTCPSIFSWVNAVYSVLQSLCLVSRLFALNLMSAKLELVLSCLEGSSARVMMAKRGAALHADRLGTEVSPTG